MYNRIKEKINFWFVDMETFSGRTMDIVVVALILLVSAVLIIKTYTIDPGLMAILNEIEKTIAWIFLAEYVLRIWSAPSRLREIFKIYSIVDLVAIVPFFFASEVYPMLRLFRGLRLLRLIRFLEGRHFFFRRFTHSHLIIIRISFIIFFIVFVSSGMIYYAEHNQPGARINTFFDAVYFSIITLSTVGYGDFTPVTGYGRFITILIVISGVIFIPWQIKELIKESILPDKKITLICTNCGLEFHDPDARFCKHCGREISAG